MSFSKHHSRSTASAVCGSLLCVAQCLAAHGKFSELAELTVASEDVGAGDVLAARGAACFEQVLSDTNLAILILSSIPPKPQDGWLGLACTCRLLRDGALRSGLRIAREDDGVELTEEQVTEFTEAFNLDVASGGTPCGNDGVIAVDNLPRLMRSCGIDGPPPPEHPPGADVDHRSDLLQHFGVASETMSRGRMFLPEFLRIVRRHFSSVAASDVQRLREAFDLVDRSGHGLLSAAELREVIFACLQEHTLLTDAEIDAELDEVLGKYAVADGLRWHRPGRFSFAAVRKLIFESG